MPDGWGAPEPPQEWVDALYEAAERDPRIAEWLAMYARNRAEVSWSQNRGNMVPDYLLSHCRHYPFVDNITTQLLALGRLMDLMEFLLSFLRTVLLC